MESIETYLSLIDDREYRKANSPLWSVMDYFMSADGFDIEMHLTLDEFER